MHVYLSLIQMQNYNKGKSESSFSEDWLKPPENQPG